MYIYTHTYLQSHFSHMYVISTDVSTYVCMYIYIYIYIHTHTFTVTPLTHVCMYVCMYVWKYVCNIHDVSNTQMGRESSKIVCHVCRYQCVRVRTPVCMYVRSVFKYAYMYYIHVLYPMYIAKEHKYAKKKQNSQHLDIVIPSPSLSRCTWTRCPCYSH
jgi:hypothetical protein